MHSFRSLVDPSASVPSLSSAERRPTLEYGCRRDRGLPISDLVRLARAWGRAVGRWGPIVRHDPETRWYALLHAGALYEVWLLGWAPGQGIDLHDHGLAAGAFYVAAGCLLEQRSDPSDATRASDALLPAGTLSAFAVGEVHGLRNMSLENATSLHVYSPRLSRMTFFDRVTAGALAPVRSEDLDPLAVESISWPRP